MPALTSARNSKGADDALRRAAVAAGSTSPHSDAASTFRFEERFFEFCGWS
jgi:hypothetical protein